MVVNVLDVLDVDVRSDVESVMLGGRMIDDDECVRARGKDPP